MTRVAPGDPAPDFDLPDAQGRTVRLRDYHGRFLVLYFYPKDFTMVCTRESCAFRDEYAGLQQLGAEVLGISGDASESHTRFSARHRLPFPLLSDVDGHVRRLYGVKKFLGLVPGRVTFVIDAGGTVRRRFESQYRGRSHVEEALEALKDLAHGSIPSQSS